MILMCNKPGAVAIFSDNFLAQRAMIEYVLGKGEKDDE